MLNVQITRESTVTGGIGQHGQRSACNDDASDGQTIKAVGKVHSVRRSNHHERNEKQKRNERNQVKIGGIGETFEYQARGEMLEERKDQVGFVLPGGTQPDQRQANAKTQAELQSQFHLSGQTQASPLHDLDVVVCETDGTKSD